MMTQRDFKYHINLPSDRIRERGNQIELKPSKHSKKSSFELVVTFYDDKMLFYYRGGKYNNKVDALDSCLSGTSVAEIFNGKIGVGN